MLERLGNVLYWLGCTVAMLIALFAVGMYMAEAHSRADGLFVTGFILAFALAAWLTGRALRYILAGRT